MSVNKLVSRSSDSSFGILAETLTSEDTVVSVASRLIAGSRLDSLTEAEMAMVKAAPPMASVPLEPFRKAIRAGVDPLGEAFLRFRSPAERRPLGATYTPSGIVRSMLGWVENQGEPARVVDPGAG